jgi:hypothetical protein
MNVLVVKGVFLFMAIGAFMDIGRILRDFVKKKFTLLLTN